MIKLCNRDVRRNEFLGSSRTAFPFISFFFLFFFFFLCQLYRFSRFRSKFGASIDSRAVATAVNFDKSLSNRGTAIGSRENARRKFVAIVNPRSCRAALASFLHGGVQRALHHVCPRSRDRECSHYHHHHGITLC